MQTPYGYLYGSSCSYRVIPLCPVGDFSSTAHKWLQAQTWEGRHSGPSTVGVFQVVVTWVRTVDDSSQRVIEVMAIQYKPDKKGSEEGAQWIWSVSENEAPAVILGSPEKWVPRIESFDQRVWCLIGDFGGREFLAESRLLLGRGKCADILSIYSLV